MYVTLMHVGQYIYLMLSLIHAEVERRISETQASNLRDNVNFLISKNFVNLGYIDLKI